MNLSKKKLDILEGKIMSQGMNTLYKKYFRVGFSRFQAKKVNFYTHIRVPSNLNFGLKTSKNTKNNKVVPLVQKNILKIGDPQKSLGV